MQSKIEIKIVILFIVIFQVRNAGEIEEVINAAKYFLGERFLLIITNFPN